MKPAGLTVVRPLGRAGLRLTDGESLNSWRPAIALVAACGLLLSGLLPWFEVGLIDDVSGFRLAGLILAFGELGGRWPPTWVGVAWFSVPLAGALTLLVVGWTGGHRRSAILCVPSTCALLVAVCALAVGASGGAGIAQGPAMAALCAAVVVVTSLLPTGWRHHPIPDQNRIS